MRTPSSSAEPAVDVQARLPSVLVSLSRVGVTAVEKVIRLRHNGGEQLFSAVFECVVDLGPDQKGAQVRAIYSSASRSLEERKYDRALVEFQKAASTAPTFAPDKCRPLSKPKPWSLPVRDPDQYRVDEWLPTFQRQEQRAHGRDLHAADLHLAQAARREAQHRAAGPQQLELREDGPQRPLDFLVRVELDLPIRAVHIADREHERQLPAPHLAQPRPL